MRWLSPLPLGNPVRPSCLSLWDLEIARMDTGMKLSREATGHEDPWKTSEGLYSGRQLRGHTAVLDLSCQGEGGVS